MSEQDPSDRSLPALRRDQLRRVDELAVTELGMPTSLLMENAGRGAAESILRRYASTGGPALILCGAGNNGGDGMVIARQLLCHGFAVELIHQHPPARLRGDAGIQRAIVDRLPIPAHTLEGQGSTLTEHLSRATLILDGLLGTGFSGDLRPDLLVVLDQIEAARSLTGSRVIALDIPSGMDCDTGQPSPRCVRADLTLSFCAAKVGFSAPGARDWTGEIEQIGLGVPAGTIRSWLDSEG
ncbi:MAG: NAD(P)H-hydrate epimerase [Planctomycetota bacterium]|jgi:NAD(P)H-hydrate epimerase